MPAEKEARYPEIQEVFEFVDKRLDRKNALRIRAVAGFQKALAIYGGGGWIRTIEGIASRFTVCPG